MSLDLNPKAFLSIAWTFEQDAMKLVNEQADLELNVPASRSKQVH